MFEKQKGSKAETSPSPQFEKSVVPEVTQAPPRARSSAVIGPSVRIKGNISGDEDIVIEGNIEGIIEFASNEVIVGASGRVRADVSAEVIKIDGEVVGDIAGREKVVISKTGKVQGNIVAPRVTLEDGAKFKGSIDMDPSESDSVSALRGGAAPGAITPARGGLSEAVSSSSSSEA